MRNLLFLHAHPDDEALLTAGTMARAQDLGHRVHLVVATDGSAGLTSSHFSHDLVFHRSAELAQSAQILGVTSVTELGYPDSGLHGQHNADGGFAGLDSAVIATRLTELIEDMRIDTLIGYDPAGGYGHPDHLQVHKVAREVHALTSINLFEATLPREPIFRAVKLAGALSLTPSDFDPETFSHSWTPKVEITHRVNVRGYTALKKKINRGARFSVDGGRNNSHPGRTEQIAQTNFRCFTRNRILRKSDLIQLRLIVHCPMVPSGFEDPAETTFAGVEQIFGLHK